MAIYAFLCFFEWGHWSLGILTEVGDTAENFGASVQLVKILILQGTFLDSVFRRIHWIHDEWFFFSWWQVVLYCGGSWMIFSASEFLSKTPQKIQQEVFKFNLALQTWNKHLTAYITFVRFLYHCLACSFYLGMRSSIWMASVFCSFFGIIWGILLLKLLMPCFTCCCVLACGLGAGIAHLPEARRDPNPGWKNFIWQGKRGHPQSPWQRGRSKCIYLGVCLCWLVVFLDKPSLLGSDTNKKASLSVTEPFVSHHSR